ncbi:hypothetical protein ACNFBT_10995 [Pseudomonas sp. NY15181]|uniref:hypothetical protein n=1 Tax=Pseudomonas sp. NY15181 TaxID=3400349 RepID=UPI003A880A6B
MSFEIERSDSGTVVKLLSGQQVETARHGIGQITGIAGRVIGWKAKNTLRALIKSPFEPAQNGFNIFGFTPTQVAGMRRRIELEASR